MRAQQQREKCWQNWQDYFSSPETFENQGTFTFVMSFPQKILRKA
jgi:hypothetical protein